MVNCDAACCSYGVWVDVQERDQILAHASLVRRTMEPQQERNPDRWFEQHEEEDADFPSGRCVGTVATARGCVFLDSVGRCVLQTAALAEGLPKFFLKPFFCASYPVLIEEGMLTIDSPDFVSRTSCCTLQTGGELGVMDVCAEELEFVLGGEGFRELKEAARQLSLVRST